MFLKIGKIVQKLKTLPKTQGKISQNPQISGKSTTLLRRKIVQKKTELVLGLVNLS